MSVFLLNMFYISKAAHFNNTVVRDRERHKIKGYIFSAYFAAAFSFLFAVVRDYSAVTYTDESTVFFQLFYSVSIVAAFGCNAITLGSRNFNKFSYFILFIVSSIGLFFIIPDGLRTSRNYLSLTLVLFAWILGAHYSRGLMECKWVFVGRSRETIASGLCAIFFFLGLSINLSFSASVLISTAVILYCYFRLIPKHTFSNKADLSIGRAGGFFTLSYESIITNLGTFIINYWALLSTSAYSDQPLNFGIDASVLIRASVYVYQLITIGAVLLVVSQRNFSWVLRKNNKFSFALLVALAGSVFFAPITYGLIVAPISCALLHYLIVASLQMKRK